MHAIFIAVDHDFITKSNRTEYTVCLGGNVSLICGFNLTSQRAFIWLSPTGTWIKRTDYDKTRGYSVEDGPDVVRLNITNATMQDDGIWNCTTVTPATVLLQIQLTVIVVGEYPI